MNTKSLTVASVLAALAGSAANAREACHFQDGTCQDLPPTVCLSLGGIPGPAGSVCDITIPDCVCVDGVIPLVEFSLDIGSDTEVSDPTIDGNEVFEPGDVYLSTQPVTLSGIDGFKDDFTIFGFDPFPDVPGPIPNPTRVPVGFGNIQQYVGFFDIDGHDQVDFDLRDIVPQDSPLPQPIPAPTFSQCVFKIDVMYLSFDDDRAVGWPAGDVPVTAPSPIGISSYGTTARRDEVIQVTFGGAFPLTVASTAGYLDEVGVHPAMGPNPDTSEDRDDDVDSLDFVITPECCPLWYFTCDHEASMGLDPGGIYLRLPAGGAAKIFDEVIHFGIPESTDVDAFEFTVINQPQTGAPVLAMLFSVDDDDTLTAPDESGGLIPGMVYISFGTGFSLPLLDTPFEDDIDGITLWCTKLATNPPCPGDVDLDGDVDFGDLNILLTNFGGFVPAGTGGDLDFDGDVDFADLNILLANFGIPCP